MPCRLQEATMRLTGMCTGGKEAMWSRMASFTRLPAHPQPLVGSTASPCSAGGPQLHDLGLGVAGWCTRACAQRCAGLKAHTDTHGVHTRTG